MSEAPRRGLLFNSAVYVFGQFVARALSFVLLIVYARFLVPEDFGVTGTLAAYGQVLAAIFVLGLHGALSRQYFDLRDDPAALKSYLSSICTFQIAFSGLLVIAFELWGERLWNAFTSGNIDFAYTRIAIWTAFLTALSQIPQTLWQTGERAATLVGVQLAQTVLAVAAGIVFVAVLQQRALGVLRSQLIATAAITVTIGILFVRRWGSRHLRWMHVRNALVMGLPLLPHVLGTILMQTVDRIMLEKYASQHEVGLYSIAMTLSMILAMVAGGVNQAWAPRYFRTTLDEPGTARANAEKFSSLFVALFAVLSLLGALFAHELSLVLGKEYQASVPYLIPFVIGNLFGIYYFLPANQLMYAGKTIWFVVATGSATLISIGLNAWLLPRGAGGIAAAWIFVAGSMIQAGVVYAAARVYDRSLFNTRHMATLAISVAALGAATYAPPLALRAAMFAGASAAIYALLVRPNRQPR